MLLRLFVSSILRFSEDVWFLHACKIGRLLPQSPLMGGPRVGATSNPLPGFERRVPWIYLSVGPRYLHSLEPITLRSNRPSAAAVRLDRPWTLMFRCHDNARALSARYISRSEPQVWTSERRVGALSGTLSCFAVTHPVPPVCDRCLQTGGVSLAHARALVAPPSLCIFHTAIFRRR